MLVKCARCGAVIGSLRDYAYGGEYGEDLIDYAFTTGDNYGGEDDGEYYCADCYDEAMEKEEE
jgi:DNA-directed RNA polymerase subunit RPC12/RpoP